MITVLGTALAMTHTSSRFQFIPTMATINHVAIPIVDRVWKDTEHRPQMALLWIFIRFALSYTSRIPSYPSSGTILVLSVRVPGMLAMMSF